MKTKTYKKALSFTLSCVLIVCFAQAQDWPNLQRYQPDNAKLKSLPAPKDRVVFMGNSITDFWINNSPAFFKNNHYVDRGISGQTSPQMLLRFRQDVIALHPKAVVIECGTNDIAGNTGPSTVAMVEDNIKSMSELARANNIKVMLCSVLPVSDYHKTENPRFEMSKNHDPQKIRELNQWMQGYCRSGNCTYVDYFSAIVDSAGMMQSDLADDGLHPNAKGYRIMAPVAQKAIDDVVRPAAVAAAPASAPVDKKRGLNPFNKK